MVRSPTTPLPVVPHDDLGEQIRERLRFLLKGRSQSEIARKTDTLVANVNRYVKGTKIPAEFCSALIHGLGVNPSWLMVGQGLPFLADATAGTAQMGSDLLALVESMNAVMKMKLGSLAGKHHLKVLRELNDALLTYERLRDRLNRHSRQIFRELLDDLANAINAREMDRAREVLKATLQVSRLCDDKDLQIELEHLQYRFEYRTGNNEKAVEHKRKVFLHRLAEGSLLDADALNAAYDLCIALDAGGRTKEARRICGAAIGLTEGFPEMAATRLKLELISGFLDISLGELKRGRERILSTLPLLSDEWQLRNSGIVAHVMLWSGSITVEGAMGLGAPSVLKSFVILRFAACTAEREVLARALREFAGNGPLQSSQEAFPTVHARLVLAALEGEGKQAAADCDEWMKCTSVRELAGVLIRPTFAAVKTQVLRLSGDMEEARKALKAADEEIRRVPDEYSLPLNVRAVHARNVLEVIPAGTRSSKQQAQRDEAKAFANDFFNRGFGSFRKLVTLD